MMYKGHILSENTEISIYFNINVASMGQFTFMDVPTIVKYHSVMNISKHFFVVIDKASLTSAYIHHCSISSSILKEQACVRLTLAGSAHVYCSYTFMKYSRRHVRITGRGLPNGQSTASKIINLMNILNCHTGYFYSISMHNT